MEIELSDNAQLVLDYFGLDESDLPELQRSVDIDALARRIEDPTKVAVCNILDRDGKVVVNGDGPVRFHVEVPVKNALKELAKKSMRFIKWWD